MEIDGWMNACFDVKIHVFHSFIILKRIIETVYYTCIMLLTGGENFLLDQKVNLSLFISNIKNYSLTSEDGCAGHADQGRCDPDHPRLRADRHPGALPLRGGPRLPEHAGDRGDGHDGDI